jgi:hypothetical protein
MRPVMSAAALWTVCLSRYCVSECLVPRKSAWLVRGATAAYCRIEKPAPALQGGRASWIIPCIIVAIVGMRKASMQMGYKNPVIKVTLLRLCKWNRMDTKNRHRIGLSFRGRFCR